MSSSLTELNSEWDTQPADRGDTVNHHSNPGTKVMNSKDTLFVGLYTAMSPRRQDLPDEIYDILRDDVSFPYHNFVDRVNPFYEDKTKMVAVPDSNADQLIEEIEELGYEVEFRRRPQFKFTPRPTIGEIVVKKVKKDAG